MNTPVYHFHESRFSTYGHPISENPVKKKVFTLKEYNNWNSKSPNFTYKDYNNYKKVDVYKK
tara:strand:+ start:39600 stop:39785 length:186 start_codon:yes stop_codon:yes gene_type:complete